MSSEYVTFSSYGPLCEQCEHVVLRKLVLPTFLTTPHNPGCRWGRQAAHIFICMHTTKAAAVEYSFSFMLAYYLDWEQINLGLCRLKRYQVLNRKIL